MSVEAWDAKHIELNRAVGYLGAPDDRIMSLAAVRYSFIANKAQAKILDLGCGEGTNTFWLGAQGHTVTGIDFSPAGIKLAKARCEAMPNITFQQADLTEKLPFPDESFDFIFDMRSIESLSIAGITSVVDEVERLLIKKGIFLSIAASPDRLPELDVQGAPATRLTKDQIEEIYGRQGFCNLVIRKNMSTDGLKREVHDWFIRAEKKDKA